MAYEIKHEILAHVIFVITQESSWQQRSSWLSGSFGYGSTKASSYEAIKQDIRWMQNKAKGIIADLSYNGE